MSKAKYKYEYFPETRRSVTWLYDKKFHKWYKGEAVCHPDDKPNESIGRALSQYRAQYKILQDIRDNELVPQIEVLKHLVANMETSKHYNPKSYEARMIRRQLKIKEQDLKSVKDMLARLHDTISEYIKLTEKALEKFAPAETVGQE